MNKNLNLRQSLALAGILNPTVHPSTIVYLIKHLGEDVEARPKEKKDWLRGIPVEVYLLWSHKLLNGKPVPSSYIHQLENCTGLLNDQEYQGLLTYIRKEYLACLT